LAPLRAFNAIRSAASIGFETGTMMLFDAFALLIVKRC